MGISQQLKLSEGNIAYEVDGAGPLVVCVPGMGDLRSTYRYNQSALIAAGFRVALVDLRGHGDSDATFASYGDEVSAGDVITLIEHLGGPAVIIGNSLGAAVGILVADRRPELVNGLALIGPFVRPPKVAAATKALMRVAMAPGLAAITWKSYLPKLYAGTKPADFEDYRASVVAVIKSPGYAKAFSLTSRESHTAPGQALSTVSTRTMIIMGERDPDFKDPAAEAKAIADTLAGEAFITMVPDTGHYPQSQRPEIVNPILCDFCVLVSHA